MNALPAALCPDYHFAHGSYRSTDTINTFFFKLELPKIRSRVCVLRLEALKNSDRTGPSMWGPCPWC